MGHHLTSFQGDVTEAVRRAVLDKIPGALVAVQGGGGHFTIDVASPVFEGKSRLESQRLVLSAIKHLMAGEGAPVHAVDSLITRTQ
jgi:acid stress-induced BolA-like protein IbaG/YrbA